MIGLLVNGSTSCPFLAVLVVLTWYASTVVGPALIVEISVPPPVAAFAQAGWAPGGVGASELAGSVLGATEPPQAAGRTRRLRRREPRRLGAGGWCTWEVPRGTSGCGTGCRGLTSWRSGGTDVADPPHLGCGCVDVPPSASVPNQPRSWSASAGPLSSAVYSLPPRSDITIDPSVIVEWFSAKRTTVCFNARWTRRQRPIRAPRASVATADSGVWEAGRFTREAGHDGHLDRGCWTRLRFLVSDSPS